MKFQINGLDMVISLFFLLLLSLKVIRNFFKIFLLILLGPANDAIQAFEISGVSRGIRALFVHDGSIEGELREPQIQDYSINESSVTVHVENNIKFSVSKLLPLVTSHVLV